MFFLIVSFPVNKIKKAELHFTDVDWFSVFLLAAPDQVVNYI